MLRRCPIEVHRNDHVHVRHVKHRQPQTFLLHHHHHTTRSRARVSAVASTSSHTCHAKPFSKLKPAFSARRLHSTAVPSETCCCNAANLRRTAEHRRRHAHLCAYRGDGQYGDFSVTQSAIFQDALNDPFTSDLNLDFDKTYLTGRRNMSIVPSVLHESRQVQGVSAFLQYQIHLQEAGEDLDLLQCALLIASHAHPDLNMQQVSDAVDELAAEVRRAHLRQPYDGGLSLGQTMANVLYNHHGFHGDSEDFYNPDNNCLNVVLAERKGSPIALALVHLLVSERVGAWSRCVLMPSHCFLKTQQGVSGFLLDPFNAGQVCNANVIEARLNGNWGFSSPVIRVGADMVSSPRLATKREVLFRLLSNLRESYWGPSSVTGRIRWTGSMREQLTPQMESTVQRALVVTRFMRATVGSVPTLTRDEGYILSCLGRQAEASKLLSHYLQETPHALDKDRVREFLLDKDINGS